MTRVGKLKICILCAFAANSTAYIIYSVFYNDDGSAAKVRFHPGLLNRSEDSVRRSPSSTSSSSAKFARNIFFLKTHKTAGSTVQNILMRFGLRHSLNFMLPKKDNYLGYSSPIKLEDMDGESVPPDKKFNVFTHHTRYRRDTNRFLYPDTVRATILRDPAELFESLFDYYNLKKLFRVSSFRQFVQSLPAAAGKDDAASAPSRKRKIRGRNQMSRDLGSELGWRQCQNRTQILGFVEYVDAEFHLVMIREHLDASLVLLADLMGWPLNYVSYLPVNVRQNTTKSGLSENDRLALSRYNGADQLLYEHFLAKFRNRVLDYGFEKLAAGVRELGSINAQLRNRCIAGENHRGFRRTIGYVLKDDSDWECVHAAKTELQFTAELRREQIYRLESIKRLQNLIEFHSPKQ